MTTEEGLCRWCLQGTVERRAFGAKARWILENPRLDHLTDLVECLGCSLVYFTAEFADAELSRMYDGYRDQSYYERRHKFEPWYTRSVNDAIGHSEQVLDHRRNHLTKLVMSAANAGDIALPHRVLDVGGDEGQFIPNLASITSRAVLEVSGAQPVAGVDSVQSWKEVRQFRPDLIMMCHVLEHTSSARKMITEAAESLSTDGLLYLEVPLDRPVRIPRLMAQRWYGSYTRWLSRHPFVFRLADLLSLVSRRILGIPIIGSVIKQNEHINFFDETSLSEVVEDFGFKRIASSVYKPSSGVPVLDVSALGLLFKRV